SLDPIVVSGHAKPNRRQRRAAFVAIAILNCPGFAQLVVWVPFVTFGRRDLAHVIHSDDAFAFARASHSCLDRYLFGCETRGHRRVEANLADACTGCAKRFTLEMSAVFEG